MSANPRTSHRSHNSVSSIETSQGVFTAHWSDKGLLALEFPSRVVARIPPLTPPYKAGEFLLFAELLREDLQTYFSGQPVVWRVPLDFGNATAFQRRVWQAIARIRFGQTRSYAWLAEQAGDAKAARAVAGACGANPLPIVIGCHRVIASDGSLGGFSAGLIWKKRLLDLEANSRCNEVLILDPSKSVLLFSEIR